MDPRRLLPYLLALTACAVLATLVLVVVTQRAGAPPVASGATVAATPREVLAEWDSRRAEAWSDGDIAALRRLYAAGSPTGREDVRMLSAYVARGLSVDGLTTQVLALDVIEESPDSLVVRVTDRVAGGVVTGGATSAALPRDRPTTRTVTMRRVDGSWRVLVVRDQASAAASTSRTSTSWKS